MAYNSRVTGEWRIDGGIDAHTLRSLPAFEWIRVRVETDVVELSDGSEKVTRWGVAVEPSQEGEWSYYTLVDELEKLLAALPPATHLDGWIVREGEEQGDVERYRAGTGNRGVVTEQATLRWDDGTIAP